MKDDNIWKDVNWGMVGVGISSIAIWYSIFAFGFSDQIWIIWSRSFVAFFTPCGCKECLSGILLFGDRAITLHPRFAYSSA